MRLDWETLYREFTAPATDGDCADLCRTGSRARAACCGTERLSLIVFADELAWARARTRCWRGRRPRTPAEAREVATWAEYAVLARCVRPRHCDRPYRSLTCRFFPLEPYFDPHEGFTALTYIYAAARICPLIRGQMDLRQDFVNQSFAVWTQILTASPEEQSTYRRASRQLRSRFARQGRTIRLFRPTAEFEAELTDTTGSC